MHKDNANHFMYLNFYFYGPQILLDVKNVYTYVYTYEHICAVELTDDTTLVVES